MANTHRGFFSIQAKAGSVYTADSLASMISAGSAIGWANQFGASAAFPRASQMEAVATPYGFDVVVMRISAGSGAWTTDPTGSVLPNASVGIPILGTDLRPQVIPGHPKDLAIWVGAACTMNFAFYEGDDLDI